MGRLKRSPVWRIARGWLLAALGAAMLMWTAVANGRPYVFTDTALYYSQAEYLFEALGVVTPATAVAPPDDPTALPARPGAPNMSAAIDGARSPLYGAPLYALQRIGGLWLVAFAQSLAAAGGVYILYRAAARAAPRLGYLALMAALAILTPLPVFASWMMPDVFAGVAGCGLIGILLYADRLSRARLAGLAGLTAYGLAVHRSNLLDAAGVAVLGAVLLAFSGVALEAIGRRLALLAALAVGAVVAGALIYVPIRAKAGEPIGTPPFLTARLVADGVGRTFLRHVCTGPTTPFALCAFRDRPLADSDQILWSNRRRTAVFVAADPATRLKMEQEDLQFALAETRAAPVDQLSASARDAVVQLGRIYVDDPLKDQRFYIANGFWRRTALPRILPGAATCTSAPGCPPRIGVRLETRLEQVGLAATVLFILWRLSAPDMRAIIARRAAPRPGDDQVRALSGLALAIGLLVINAGVCGALSGPFARYQARIIWTPMLAAGLLAAGCGWQRGAPIALKTRRKATTAAGPCPALDATGARL